MKHYQIRSRDKHTVLFEGFFDSFNILDGKRLLPLAEKLTARVLKQRLTG